MRCEKCEVFRKLFDQAHELGIPVIGEYFPVNDEKLSEEQMYHEVKIGTRILYELGADVIKTFHTKDFEKVVAGCPTPTHFRASGIFKKVPKVPKNPRIIAQVGVKLKHFAG